MTHFNFSFFFLRCWYEVLQGLNWIFIHVFHFIPPFVSPLSCWSPQIVKKKSKQKKEILNRLHFCWKIGQNATEPRSDNYGQLISSLSWQILWWRLSINKNKTASSLFTPLKDCKNVPSWDLQMHGPQNQYGEEGDLLYMDCLTKYLISVQ